jgi:hypothetical protein
MMTLNVAVGRAERNAAGEAVRDEHAVEGIARPGQAQRAAHQTRQENIVNSEPRILHHGVREFRAPNSEAATLGKQLDLEK